MTPDDDLFAAPDVESPTAKLRAVPAVAPDPVELTVGPGPLPAELSDPAIEPLHLAEPAPLGDMVASDDTAEILHSLACACPRIDDRPRHQGYDFHELGAALDARIQERLVEQLLGEYTLTPIGRGEPTEKTLRPAVARHAALAPAPVEAKVSAGALVGGLATVVLSATTAILSQFDTFRPLFGSSPWSAPLVLVVGAVLTGAHTWAAYQAPHTPRDTP